MKRHPGVRWHVCGLVQQSPRSLQVAVHSAMQLPDVRASFLGVMTALKLPRTPFQTCHWIFLQVAVTPQCSCLTFLCRSWL
jgi:hypothetical protein